MQEELDNLKYLKFETSSLNLMSLKLLEVYDFLE